MNKEQSRQLGIARSRVTKASALLCKVALKYADAVRILHCVECETGHNTDVDKVVRKALGI